MGVDGESRRHLGVPHEPADRQRRDSGSHAEARVGVAQRMKRQVGRENLGFGIRPRNRRLKDEPIEIQVIEKRIPVESQGGLSLVNREGWVSEKAFTVGFGNREASGSFRRGWEAR